MILWKIIDVVYIDGLVNKIGAFFLGVGSTVRTIQTGYTRSYAMAMVFGALFLVGFWLVGLGD